MDWWRKCIRNQRIVCIQQNDIVGNRLALLTSPALLTGEQDRGASSHRALPSSMKIVCKQKI